MRKSCRTVAVALAMVLAIGSQAGLAQAADKLKVVASFSIIADFVRNVGGDDVVVETLVRPGGDAHVYSPTPADAKGVSAARLVIINGLGFEGWLTRLVASAGGTATVVTASRGIEPRKGTELHDHAGIDPHAWQSVANAKIYVADIRDALVVADPDHSDSYRGNAGRYLAKLDALDREIREAVAQIPLERRKVISAHDAFGYFADAYGIAFIAPQGVSTESEPNARDIAQIITQIRAQHVPAVFLENISDPRLIRQIAGETGVSIGGTLYSDTLTDEKGDAPTYIDMVRHNIKALAKALIP